MRTAIIVNDTDNLSLLYFTQTKLFYNAHNKAIHLFKDCVTVESYSQAKQIAKGNDIVLEIGDVLTPEFIDKYKHSPSVVYTKDQPDVIRFDKDKPMDEKSLMKELLQPYGDDKRIIISKLLKMVTESANKIYLRQTEQLDIEYNPSCKHFYGLASGWKSMMHCVKHQYETVTLFDHCNRQLNFAEALQTQMSLPLDYQIDEPVMGPWNPPQKVIDSWHIWHSMDVKFQKINLLEIPIFPKQSLVWMSNVFNWEPNIYRYGYDKLKYLENQLAETNSECIFVRQEGINYGQTI